MANDIPPRPSENIDAALVGIAEELPRPPEWHEAVRNLGSATRDETRLSIYQALRDEGVVGQIVEQGVFQFGLDQRRQLGHAEKFNDDGVFKDIGGPNHFLPALREPHEPSFVPALCESLIQQAVDLALKFAGRPVVFDGLDLIEQVRQPMINAGGQTKAAEGLGARSGLGATRRGDGARGEGAKGRSGGRRREIAAERSQVNSSFLCFLRQTDFARVWLNVTAFSHADCGDVERSAPRAENL